MKNIFLCLTKANAILKTGGGNSQIFKHFWQYAACLLLAFFVGIGNVWGEDVTFTTTSGSSTPSWSGTTSTSESGTVGDYTVTFNKNTSGSSITMNNSYIGTVKGMTIVVSSTSKTFTKVILNFSSKDYGPNKKDDWENRLTASSGSITKKSDTQFEWSGEASSSITFNHVNNGTQSDNNYRFTSIIVTPYSSGTSTYSVTYNGNGKTDGDVPADSNSPYAKDATVTVLGNTGNLEKTNYTFTGWNTKADGSGTHYDADDTFDMGTSNVTLYAEWEYNFTTHTPGIYTSTEAGGYGRTLKSVGGRDYEVYLLISETSDKGSLYAGPNASTTDGYALFKNAAKGTMSVATDGWLILLTSGYSGSGNVTTDEFSKMSGGSNLSTHYAAIQNTHYVKFKISGYDQFSFIGRDNHASNDGKQFVVKIDGEVQTYTHNGTDNSIFRFDISTGTHIIEITGNGANDNRFRGFSLRLPEAACSAPTSPTITATPASAAYTEGDNISLTASATGTDGSTTYTWYKGADWATASAGSSIGSAATFTKNSCVEGDAGTYWCEISNGTGCEVQVSKTITVAAAPAANPVITAAVNDAGWGSVSPANITVSNGKTVSIDGAVLTCDGKTLTATATTATAEYTYAFVNWTGVSNGDAITANVTATANFSRTANSYAVNYTAPTNGSYTIKVGDAAAVSENTTAAYGTTVTLAATPASGYRLAGWTVAKAVGTVTVTNNQFTMPAEAVTVSAAFEEIPCPTSGEVFAYTSKTGISNADINAGTYTYTPANPGSYLTSVTGGQAVMYVPSDGNMRIRGSQLAFNSSNSYIKIELDCELKVGDTILVNSSGNTNDLWIGLSTSRPDNAEAAAAVIKQGTGYVVAAESALDDNIKNLYFWRNSNTTQIGNVSILRPAKYAMTFAKGDEGASGTMDAQSVIEKSQVTLPACTFTAPEGKEFDAWVVTKTAGGAAVTVTDGKFTMPAEAVTLTATWKALTVKYAVTYNLGGASGDAPTETNKEAGAEFTLADAPTWEDHVFEGWQWTDDESATHLEDAEAEFTMPAYAVTFTAQWRLDPQATMSNAQYVIGGSALNMAAKFSSLNTSGAVIFSLKESYEGAEITPAGSFTATVAGEYIVVAEQAGDGTYANGSAEATVEVLESELSDIYIWNKNSSHGGSGKCVTSDQANQDINANQASTTLNYSILTMEGMSAMGRPGTAGDVTLTFAVKNAYSSIFAIASVCAYGKIEEPGGIEYSWDNTNWTAVDGGESDNNKHEFEAPAGVYPTNFFIRFTNAETGKGGLWLRNALVTLEAKKAIVSTVIDLTDVKINNSSISAANLATLKTGPAYALDLADEYVTAPTVKFNKHTVITYEDDSEVEKDDVISETATVNLSGKWEASAEIDAITYTVTMAKADAFVVHYYQSDGETLIGSENVAVNGNPTGTGIAPTPIDYKESYWTLNSAEVALNTVTSDEAGTIINLVAAYRTAYASSINIEKWVLDNRKNNTAFRAVLDARHYQYANLNDLDSLTTEKNDGDRNYPFLGQKIKTTGGYISFLLKAGSELHVKFGNIPAAVNLIVNDGEPVAKSASFDYTAVGSDEIIKLATTTDGTVVFKQIMIDEAIETVVLPAIVTYDANGGSFAKTSEKYTGTPLVIGDATPANPTEYEFEGWHLGSVEGAKIDAAAYEPTKNVTLVAKYVVKPSPFSLSALTYKIGTGDATAVGYEEGTYTYDVELPYAPSYETITVAYTLADGTSSEKSGAVLSVTSVPGAATFTIVAANTTEKTYTVNFKKDVKDGLSIIKATISGGDESTGFDATGLYAGKGYAKTSSRKLNSDNYVGVQLKAGQSFQAGDKLFVVTSTDADRGYIELYQEAAGTNLVKALGVRDASAGIELPSEAYGLNELYIVRKTSDGDQSWNGTVNYVEVTRPMNPVLKSITFDDNKIDVTSTTVAETLPYATDLTAVTAEYFWNGAGTAVVTTNEGAWAWGENTYVLTDKDGDATTYTISLTRAERSTDATLSSLTVNGNAMELVADKYEYTYEYPYGTDPATVPVVAAEANDAHKHSMDITQATNATGTAEIVVVAEDETTTLTYTVRFCISRNQTLVIYDGKESEPMNAIANPGSLEPGLEWTIKDPNSTSASSADAVVFEGKSYKKYVQLFTSATASTTRYMTITIPENYLAKFRLVGCGNGNSDRSLFISKEITSTRDESIAFVHTTSATITGMTSDYQYPGTYYLCCDASIRIYELSVTLYPIDYTRNVTDGRFGTICLQHGGIMRGAAVYEVAYFNPDNKKIYFDEVLSGEMVPGMPYVFLPDQGNNDQLVVMYGNNAPAAVAGHHNGLYGSFSEELLEANTVNYILQSNQYWYVNSGEVYVGENRAYLKVAEIYGYQGEPEPAPAQGRRRVVMDAGAQAPQTPTGLDNVQGDNVQSAKVLIDGKMYILRGEKMYDATGRLVK